MAVNNNKIKHILVKANKEKKIFSISYYKNAFIETNVCLFDIRY